MCLRSPPVHAGTSWCGGWAMQSSSWHAAPTARHLGKPCKGEGASEAPGSGCISQNTQKDSARYRTKSKACQLPFRAETWRSAGEGTEGARPRVGVGTTCQGQEGPAQCLCIVHIQITPQGAWLHPKLSWWGGQEGPAKTFLCCGWAGPLTPQHHWRRRPLWFPPATQGSKLPCELFYLAGACLRKVLHFAKSLCVHSITQATSLQNYSGI